ncbi:MAG: J domain-containing protein [Clostridia bacterium]|nr:J domain-containing protein [Clostridia bacterium]
MTDPYKILNVPRTANDEEVKKAYRALARKYHPDNYAGSDLADMAQEKMKEINEAYDLIRKERSANGTRPAQSYGQGTGGGTYTHEDASTTTARIRFLINAGRFDEAAVLLDSIGEPSRGAEWNYLKGCILLQKGWYFEAQRYFEIACYMDPANQEYAAAMENIRSSANQYGKTYQSSDCTPCKVITALICADGLCECCGGDLIRCC